MQNNLEDPHHQSPPCGHPFPSRRTGIPILHLSLPGLLPVHGMATVQLVHHPHLLPILSAAGRAVHHHDHRIVPPSLPSIEYDLFFTNKHITESIYLLVEEIYFIFAILISHYVYRVFKNHSNGEGLIFNNNPPPNDPQGQGQYRPLVDENRPNRVDQQGGVFQGEGVRIGWYHISLIITNTPITNHHSPSLPLL